MRYVVAGLEFDTVQATQIAAWSSAGAEDDLHRCRETLYRTPDGRYFLVGSGGSLSTWRVRTHSGGYAPGEGIVPVTPYEAQRWCEDHGILSEQARRCFDFSLGAQGLRSPQPAATRLQPR